MLVFFRVSDHGFFDLPRARTRWKNARVVRGRFGCEELRHRQAYVEAGTHHQASDIGVRANIFRQENPALSRFSSVMPRQRPYCLEKKIAYYEAIAGFSNMGHLFSLIDVNDGTGL